MCALSAVTTISERSTSSLILSRSNSVSATLQRRSFSDASPRLRGRRAHLISQLLVSRLTLTHSSLIPSTRITHHVPDDGAHTADTECTTLCIHVPLETINARTGRSESAPTNHDAGQG